MVRDPRLTYFFFSTIGWGKEGSMDLLSEGMREQHANDIIRYAARRAGLPDVELKSAREAMDELKADYPELHARLEAYLQAYAAWFETARQCVAHPNPLAETDHLGLRDAAERRDSARKALKQSCERGALEYR
jgi:hypothetical protein